MSRQSSRNPTERLLTQLELYCARGDIRPLAEELTQHMSPYVLTRFRERKMIFRVPGHARQAVALAMQGAAKSLEPADRLQFEKYLLFATLTNAARSKLFGELRAQLRLFPSCSTGDLLDVGNEVFETFAERLTRASRAVAKNDAVASGERQLHDLNGQLVDLAHGIARAVNEFARTSHFERAHRPLQRRERSRAVESMRRALVIAAQLNSIEWILDSVTFGDFTVVEAVATPKPRIRLDFADPRTALMRRLATRRSFILKFAGQREARYVRELLRALQTPIFADALEYYSSSEGVLLTESEFESAKTMVSKSLVFIDAEDDLLLAAGQMDLKIQAYYTAAMALHCFAMVGSVVKASQSGSKRVIGASAIPIELIATRFDDGADGAVLARAIDQLTVDLPVRRHEQIFAAGFVREDENSVRPFLGGDNGMWNVAVREALLQGGALGKSVGAVWEGFTKVSFKGTDWQVVGEGIKLRENGRTLTDVDLMLVREDLLLLVQIKGLIGLANTTYDHWKNRQVIQAGCAQARLAADFFAKNPHSLLSICGRRIFERIRVLQPVVLTNIGTLDGFSYLDVPVIGEATRKAICRGSKVDFYKSASHELVHTHVFVDQSALNTAEILHLLREPIELLIAAEKPETVHRYDQLGSVSFYMPEFAERDDGFQWPEMDAVTRGGQKTVDSIVPTQ